MGKHKPKKGRSARKARAGLRTEEVEEVYKACPHSFIFNRGHVGRTVSSLILDMRRVMEPFTASRLKVRQSNVLKDFVAVAGTLNVSHFIAFSKTKLSTYMKVIRLPRGPTLTFKVNSYSLSRDVISSLSHHHMDAKQFTHHPLLIMNKFSGEGLHLKLMSTMFQNLFPSLQINKMKLCDVRRCVLLNYNADNETVEFRHYNIRVVPAGLSKGVKKLVTAKVPNLSKLNDISEFLNRDGQVSESEAELDGAHNEVTVTQKVAGRGNSMFSKSAIRLTEIGPRLSLQLQKIEEGLNEGQVLYHNFIVKTEQEQELIQERRSRKRKQKIQRRQQQEANVKNKKKNSQRITEEQDLQYDPLLPTERRMKEKEEDSDNEYYRQEVGEDMEKDDGVVRRKGLTFKRRKRGSSFQQTTQSRKKFRPASRD